MDNRVFGTKITSCNKTAWLPYCQTIAGVPIFWKLPPTIAVRSLRSGTTLTICAPNVHQVLCDKGSDVDINVDAYQDRDFQLRFFSLQGEFPGDDGGQSHDMSDYGLTV